MASAVLDASAILAVLNSEPGAELVISTLDDAVVSIVNYAEVVSKLIERGAALTQVRLAFSKLGIRIVGYDVALADRTGELRVQTKHLGLSLADRACLALAEQEDAPVLTSDRKWARLMLGVEVTVIR